MAKPLGKRVRPAMIRKDNIKEVIRKLHRGRKLDRTDSDHNKWVFCISDTLLLCVYLFTYLFSYMKFTVTVALIPLRNIRHASP